MTPYGCGVWAQIVQAALNGGRCKCLCDKDMFHPPKRSCLCEERPMGMYICTCTYECQREHAYLSAQKTIMIRL
jgi:hypothetical protein